MVESKVVDVGDLQVEVRSQGSGDAVVVLSGFGPGASYLDGFGHVLAQR
jgi:hypothetical protein